MNEQHVATLPEKLAREIGRVTKLREQYAAVERLLGGGNCRPAMAMMDASLEAAKLAAGSPDVVGQIRAVKDLEGFSA